MHQFFKTINSSRTNLEGLSLEQCSTAEAVTFVTMLQDLRRSLKQWTVDVETFKTGTKILERQRYSFPSDWLQIDHLQGEWGAFQDIMARKGADVQAQLGSLQMRVVEEDRMLEQRVLNVLADWEKNKPVGGSVAPDAAVNTLAIYESRFTKIREELDSMAKAKEALDLDVKLDTRISPCLNELEGMKVSWSELSRIWTSISDLKNLSWTAVVPRKVRGALDDLVNQLKNLPAGVRAFPSYQSTLATVKRYIAANVHVVNLKSDSLKERHWKELIHLLGVDWVLVDLTLGAVWKVDLEKNKDSLMLIMSKAGGEMALEDFIKQVKEEWSELELELVNYQNKTRLIRGWDDLFNKAKEHINSLAAMRMSPYFKFFQSDVEAWEGKLNNLDLLFNVWMDVQRQWVYLEGIFTGSAEIKHLLPTETNRFQSISQEFTGIMKTVTKSPNALEVTAIPNITQSLERLQDLLNKIQKALGEYLERERTMFPRFYFVGDEV